MWSSFGELRRNIHDFLIMRSFYSPHSKLKQYMTIQCNGCSVTSFTTIEVHLEYRIMEADEIGKIEKNPKLAVFRAS
jgi:hypothetical protein